MAGFVKNAVALVVAAIVTYVLAVSAATQSVMASLKGMGVSVSLADRLGTTLADLSGMFALFMPLLAIALLLGFLVAAGIIRWQPGWRSFGYPLAGFLAVLVMHLLVQSTTGIHPIPATRSMLGLVLQGLAGAAGGYVFHLVKARADLPPGPDASSNAS
jgi:hypothetical protein